MQETIYKDEPFADDDEESVSLSEIFNTLWMRRRLLISVTLLISIIAVFFIFQLVPRFTATTQLLIGINSAKVVDIEDVISGNLSGDSAILAEMEVLKSRELALRVIDKLNLEQYAEFNPELKVPGFLAQFHPRHLIPQEWLELSGSKEIIEPTEEEALQRKKTIITNIFLGKLKVSQVKRSQIINLAYESESPKLAAEIVNMIADQYILGQLQAKFDATKKATDWLNDQLGDLKQKVEYSELAVESYRQTHGLLEVSKDKGLSQQQLSEINSQLIITRAERAEAQAKYNQVASILKTGKKIDMVSEVLKSALIQNLRSQEAEVQRNYSEMLVEYGKKHPKMIQMNAKLADIRAKIKTEVQKIAASLRNDLEVVRSREASIAASLKEIEGTTSGNKQQEVQLHALEREAQANRILFETFLSRFKETSSTQDIQQADARVISFAEPPLGASFPKKKLLLIVSVLGALFFAIVLVFVLEMLNPGVRSPEQVQELFHQPTLGIVPKVYEKMPVQDYLLEKPQSSLSEAINTLRVSLSVLSPDSKVKTLLITSSVPSEGKSTLSALIARQTAKSDQRVIMVDTDFRRPTMEKFFNLEKNTPGLSDLMANHDLQLKDVLVKDPKTGMFLLTHGTAAVINPTDIFASKRMHSMLNKLKASFDLVVMDAPPVMAVPDARVLSGLVDKVIFVVNWDETPRKVIKSALAQLQREGHHNLAGVVLQQVDLKQYGRYGGYGDSGYYYHYGQYGHYYTS